MAKTSTAVSNVVKKAPSLALVVRRTDGAVILPDKAGWLNRIQIRGSTGNAYVVAMRRTDSVWGCSCRGWVGYRKCKHLTAMFPALKLAFPQSKLHIPLIRAPRPKTKTRSIKKSSVKITNEIRLLTSMKAKAVAVKRKLKAKTSTKPLKRMSRR